MTHRLLYKLPILVICAIAAPAEAMCIITIAPPAGAVDANARPRLYGCPRIDHGVELQSPPTARAGGRDAEPVASAVPGRSARDDRIARALGQGYAGFKKVHKGQRYTGFEKVYRGQLYLGFRKVYSGPRYPADLYGSGSRWGF
jgi:hypothetical protein